MERQRKNPSWGTSSPSSSGKYVRSLPNEETDILYPQAIMHVTLEIIVRPMICKICALQKKITKSDCASLTDTFLNVCVR